MHESICLSVDLDLRHERESVQVVEHLFSCGKAILFPSLMGNLAAIGIPQKDFALGLQSFEHHEFMVSKKHFDVGFVHNILQYCDSVWITVYNIPKDVERIYTDMLVEDCSKIVQQERVDKAFIEKHIEKISVDKDGYVIVRFINGAELTNREEVEVCKIDQE